MFQCHLMRMTEMTLCGSWIMTTWRTCMACSRKLMVRQYLVYINFVILISSFSITFSCFLLSCFSARERIVGWYHTGPKLHKNDIAINELIKQYCTNSVCNFWFGFGSTSFLIRFILRINNWNMYLSLSYQVLVIIDVKPKDLGLPTEAYISVEEIHDVSHKNKAKRSVVFCDVAVGLHLDQIFLYGHVFLCRTALPHQRHLSMSPVRLELKKQRKWEWSTC